MKSRSCRPSAADDAVLLTGKPLNLSAAVRRCASPERGALVTFSGTVRNTEAPITAPGAASKVRWKAAGGGSPIRSITYEAYRGMARTELGRIVLEAGKRWNVSVAVQHRTGRVAAGDPSLIVASAGVHRREAFQACRFVVDQIKARAAIWKVGYEWAP